MSLPFRSGAENPGRGARGAGLVRLLRAPLSAHAEQSLLLVPALALLALVGWREARRIQGTEHEAALQ